jgi:hypothetical protein
VLVWPSHSRSCSRLRPYELRGAMGMRGSRAPLKGAWESVNTTRAGADPISGSMPRMIWRIRPSSSPDPYNTLAYKYHAFYTFTTESMLSDSRFTLTFNLSFKVHWDRLRYSPFQPCRQWVAETDNIVENRYHVMCII